MCGIFGMIGERFAGDFDAGLDALTHRGPDERGTFRDGDLRLGHRRLSIIDLAGGHQPMSTPDGRYTLVYNGELYNFRDLRTDLERDGITLATHSDTEVMLHALARDGVDALAGFDGMFALALWDTRERTLLMARDRIGIKPVFYSQVGGLVFASTLEPFWKLRGFPRKLCPEALREYLASQFVASPRTILRDVRALEPGTWLRWRDDAIETGRYWDIPPPLPAEEAMAFDDLVEATDAALRESVKRQLVADVPLGAFLSGGIDSSLMVAYMSEAAGEAVKTFTVRFDQSRRDDESAVARLVSQTFGTEHHELPATDIAGDAFLDAVAAMGQPFGDPSYLPEMTLSELTRKHVTVAIAGDGGDELFGGYHRYLRGEDAYPDTAFHRAIRRGVEAGALPTAWHRFSLRGQRRVLRGFARMGDFPVTTRGIGSVLTRDAADALQLDQTLGDLRDAALRWNGSMDTDSLMRADVWYFLTQNCLVKTDRASMTHSLEVRVPILGNQVLDLTLPQPASVKMQGGFKAVLKTIARRRLPREVWDRPKHGFDVPVQDYVCNRWRSQCDELIADCADLAPFLDHREIQRRWRMELAGRKVDWPVYGFIVLLAWLRSHKVEM